MCALAPCTVTTNARYCWKPPASSASTLPANVSVSNWRWILPAPNFSAVWAALLAIPFGETRSYSDIARQIGNPSAVRAVGAANGRNPISIIAPCHRVIGASGSLTGFAGGTAAKQYLLALEGRQSLALDL